MGTEEKNVVPRLLWRARRSTPSWHGSDARIFVLGCLLFPERKNSLLAFI
jgi:hypothetical protein